MRGDEHRERWVVGHALAHDREDLASDDRIEAGSGLVEHEKVRPRGEAGSELQLHTLTARQVANVDSGGDRPVGARGLVHDVHAVEQPLERPIVEAGVRVAPGGRNLGDAHELRVGAHGRYEVDP